MDLGSANGSRVSGVQLAANTPVEVEVGEVFELGSSLVVTQRVNPSSTKNRLFTHTFFELHLEQACSQARSSKHRGLAVVRARIEGALPAHAVRTIYSEALLPGEIVAQYAPGDYELFVPDTGNERATELAETLTDRLEAAGASNARFARRKTAD